MFALKFLHNILSEKMKACDIFSVIRFSYMLCKEIVLLF